MRINDSKLVIMFNQKRTEEVKRDNNIFIEGLD